MLRNKKNIGIKYATLSIVALLALMLTACHAPVIFEHKTDPYAQVELTPDELESDTWYVKSGTKFVAVFSPQGSAKGTVESPDPKRVFWMSRGEALVPTFYKGDSLAIKSTDATLDSVTLERFKDAGYSIGVYGASYDESSGTITLDAQENLAAGYPVAQAFSSFSDHIQIQSIGGKNVTADSLDASGVITGLNKDEVYSIAYYSGTEYGTTQIQASAHMLESWEIIEADDIEPTKRGYFSVNMPDDLKSGWYFVEGSGIFKYVDHERGEGDMPEGDAMNVEYYDSDMDALAVYSQVFAVNFDKRTLSPTIEVVYDITSLNEGQEVKGLIIAPDGTQYDMVQSNTQPALDDTNYTSSDGTITRAFLTCSLDSATAGKWEAVIQPKNIKVLTINVFSNNLNADAIEVKKDFEFTQDTSNITFYAKYQLENQDSLNNTNESVNIHGYLIAPDGETTEFTVDSQNHRLICNVAYIKAGTYTVQMYHYNDSTLTEDDIGYTDDINKINEEQIVTVTG